MRRCIIGSLVATVAIALASAAWAGNQQVAEQIAQSLRQSGQMQDYKIGVKYQQGTVWLVGRVASEQQLTTALNLVMQLPHVDRVVNNLSVSNRDAEHEQVTRKAPESAPNTMAARGSLPSTAGHPHARTAAERLQRAVDNRAEPSQPREQSDVLNERKRADRVPASFEPMPAEPTSAAQPTPALRPQEAPAQAQPMAAQPVQAQPAAAQPMQAQPRVAQRPVPVAHMQPHAGAMAPAGMAPSGPRPMYTAAAGGGVAPARYDMPRMPNYAWPSYAPYPNYAAVTYPKQYSPTAWPYIGPFYPYPQVPLGWRKVTLEWDNGWWMLDFKDR